MLNRIENPRSGWIFSILIHGTLILGAYWVLNFQPKESTEKIPFEVISNPTPVTGAVKNSVPKNTLPLPLAPKPKPQSNSRAVFGQSKLALTSQDSNVSMKAGNTVAKEVDNLKLKEGDAAALPVPVDDYMVTQMPKLSREVRATYPVEAKQKRVQGVVSLELLIDQEGRVRQAKVLQGPGAGLNEAATQAALQFLFEPARVGDNRVAVMIRYNYKFILE